MNAISNCIGKGTFDEFIKGIDDVCIYNVQRRDWKGRNKGEIIIIIMMMVIYRR